MKENQYQFYRKRKHVPQGHTVMTSRDWTNRSWYNTEIKNMQRLSSNSILEERVEHFQS